MIVILYRLEASVPVRVGLQADNVIDVFQAILTYKSVTLWDVNSATVTVQEQSAATLPVIL